MMHESCAVECPLREFVHAQYLELESVAEFPGKRVRDDSQILLVFEQKSCSMH